MSGLSQGSYTRTNGAQDAGKVYPRFFIDTVKDEAASLREGWDVFKDEERVEIIFPGNQHTKPVFKVTREYTDRWPEEYKAFKAGEEMALNGTPLEHWPLLKRAQVMEMKSRGFRTVEEVAAMSEHAIQQMPMAGRRLCELAKSYLDDAAALALLARTTAENEANARTIAEQNDKIANLSALCERISGELMALRNTPSAVATYVPGQHDPMEALRQAQPQAPAAQSSLMDLPVPRRRKAAEGMPS